MGSVVRGTDLTGLKRQLVGQDPRVDQVAYSSDAGADLSGLKDPSKYFSNFFNAYARGVNKATQRTGALFARPFKRIPVDSTTYLMQLILYVHQNPQKHKFVNDFREWIYSSYHLLVPEAPTRLQRERVIQLFGSREDFDRIHEEIQPLIGLEDEE